jgi:hypothetical protein
MIDRGRSGVGVTGLLTPAGVRTAAAVGWRFLRRRIAWAVVAGLLLVAHGCHGDEDHELFARLIQGIVRAR